MSVSLFQAVYKAYDTDGSGVIGADELPNAFRAAGKMIFLSLKLNYRKGN